MKHLLIIGIACLGSCAPFGDVANPAAESLAGIKRVFDKDNSVAVKLINKSDLSAEIKQALTAGFAQDRQAVDELTKGLIEYLKRLGDIKWDTSTLKALWSSVNSPDGGPNSVWNDEKIKELIKN